MANLVKICVFWNIWKNEKWLTLIRKISVTKVRKSKIWDDSFLAFSVAFVVVYFIFSVDAIFMGKIADQNRHFWIFSKNSKKCVFVRQNLTLRNFFPQFFISPSSWPVQELRFAPPNFNRGLKTRISSDDRWVIINDHFVTKIKFFHRSRYDQSDRSKLRQNQASYEKNW